VAEVPQVKVRVFETSPAPGGTEALEKLRMLLQMLFRHPRGEVLASLEQALGNPLM
jgi:hypothetical protein